MTAGSGDRGGVSGTAGPERVLGKSEGATAGISTAGDVGEMGGKGAELLAGPTMDELFAATGIERMLLMGRFIQTASVAELAAVIERAGRERVADFTFTDQAWLRWVELDLEGALSQPRPRSAWWAYAKLDPMGALARAVERESSQLGEVLYSIGQGDPGMAREWLARHPEVDGELVTRGIMDGLTRGDAGAATEYALEKNSYALEANFKRWMEEDGEAAAAWVRGLKNPMARRRMEEVQVGELIERDPAAGLAAARKLPLGEGGVQRTIEAIAALSREDPVAARAAVDQMTSPTMRQKALGALAQATLLRDPAAAAALIGELDWKALRTGGEISWRYTNAKTGNTNFGSNGEIVSHKILRRMMTAGPVVTVEALAARISQLAADPSAEVSEVPLSTAVKTWATQ